MTKAEIFNKLKTGDLFLVTSNFNLIRHYYLVTEVEGAGIHKEVYTKLSDNKGIHRFTYDSIAFENRSKLFSVKLITNPKEIKVIKTLYFKED